VSDKTKEQWPERDQFWPKGDPSPYEGPEQGGRVDLPGVTDPLRREVPESE
jgi:hypothetical protein